MRIKAVILNKKKRHKQSAEKGRHDNIDDPVDPVAVNTLNKICYLGYRVDVSVLSKECREMASKDNRGSDLQRKKVTREVDDI